MGADRVIIDTGPLVSLLNEHDAMHPRCAIAAQSIRPPLLTTWLVVAEAAWLLRRTLDGPLRLLRLIESGVVACPELGEQAATWMAIYVQKYADMKPQLADVSLVYLAERERATIFTLDKRDFSVYRINRSQRLTLLQI